MHKDSHFFLQSAVQEVTGNLTSETSETDGKGYVIALGEYTFLFLCMQVL